MGVFRYSCNYPFLILFLDYSQCGESPVDLRARMVGGRISERGWWPWQIGLYKLNNKGNTMLFGGV